MSFDDSIHSLVDPTDENGFDTMYGPDDLDLDRLRDFGRDADEAFYPEWDGPSADELALDQQEIDATREQGWDDSATFVPCDFHPPFFTDDIPF